MFLSDISDIEDFDGDVSIECATTIKKRLQFKEDHLDLTDLTKASEKESLVLRKLIGLTFDDTVVEKVTVRDKLSKNKTVEIDAVVLFKTVPVMDLESMLIEL